MGKLDEILANKREELRRLRGTQPQAGLEASCRGLGPAREFEAARANGLCEVRKPSLRCRRTHANEHHRDDRNA